MKKITKKWLKNTLKIKKVNGRKRKLKSLYQSILTKI